MRVTTGTFLLAALVLAACQANDTTRHGRAAAPTAPAADGATDALAGTAFDEGGDGDVRARTGNNLAYDSFDKDSPQLGATTAPAAAERLLIQTGQVRVEVSQPDEVMASFRTQVIAWGGHLQSQSDQTLVVRIPAQHFDDAFDWVKNSGRVLAESRRAQDVTEEFLDLGIRIDNARKSRDRLLEILQKADKVADILKVEAELRRLTEEIERMEGRRKFLADQVQLATLSATFESIAAPPIAKRRRQPSRFHWINRIGAERVLEDF